MDLDRVEKLIQLMQRYDLGELQLKDGDSEFSARRGEKPQAIVVAAGGPEVPPPLVEQLAPGGRMLIPLERGGAQTLTLVERTAGELRHTLLGDARFVPLVGEHGFDA